MKKVWVSNETPMVLESLKNIDKYHSLYDTFYEKEVNDNFHVHVFGNAVVASNARVSESAIVHDNAIIRGRAEVYGNARISGNALVYDNAEVYGNAEVSGNTGVGGNATVSDDAIVVGDAIVYGYAKVFGNAIVSDDAKVSGNAIVCGNTRVTKNVLNLSGLPYNITITNNHIQIGCKTLTFDAAKKLAERNTNINNVDYDMMIKHKELLLSLIKARELENE